MKSSKPFTASTCDVFVKEWELHLFIIYYLFRYIHVFLYTVRLCLLILSKEWVSILEPSSTELHA
mgnify:CR=1 FL=1